MKRTDAVLFRFLSLQLLLGSAVTALGQTAHLSGAIRDSSRAVVVGATVSISNEGTGQGQTTSSSEQGFYRFAFLLPGSYTIRVEAAGFSVVDRPGVRLVPEQEARVDFILMPAAVKQSITVRGSVSSLQTESSAVSTDIDAQLVEDLPLNGRTFQSLIALAPGVVRPGTLNQTDVQTGTFISGQRATENYYSVDGVSANLGDAGGTLPVTTVLGTTHNLVSVDDMQAFKLQTSTSPAEFGHAIGGQVNIVTRSGTNEFHGSVFDYFRNEVLDANDWFSNSYGLSRPAHRQNDFGGTFGGAFLKSRGFFFFSYEGLRLLQPYPFRSSVPSLNARRAATGAVQQLLNAFPLPNGPENPTTLLASLVGDGSDQVSSDNTSIRVDQMLNQKISVFTRYSEAPSEETLAGFAGYKQKNVANFRSITFGATVLLSHKATSDFRANYSSFESGLSFGPDRTAGATPPPDSLLFPVPFASRNSSLFVLNGLGHPFSQGRRGANLQQQGNVVSNTSVLLGSHELRFGADYRYLAPRPGPPAYSQRVFFAGVASALTGVAQNVNIESSDQITLGFQDLALYGQDSWKFSPRFAFTYGLRWELTPPPHTTGHQALLTLTGFPDITNLQIAPLGTPIYKTTYDNLAPRLGAAYQFSQRPGRETVVRGGFGIYYQRGTGYISEPATGFPHSLVKTISGVPLPLSSQQTAPPPPVSLNPPYNATFNVFAPDYQLPRSYQWNLTVDQSFGANQLLSASYVGEAGRNLLRQISLFGPTAQFPGQINIITNGSSSNYQALQLQFQRRMTHGLAALLSYTWSHSIDDTSDDEGIDNLSNPSIDRGASAFDVRHAFNAALTYEIPGVERNRVLRGILSHWSADSIFTVRTALPINVYMNFFDSGILEPTLLQARPDRVPGVPLYIHDAMFPGGRRVNPAAFSAQTELRQGNLERNLVRGFPLTQWDFDIRRQFGITENLKLQFRADFFNFLNHPNFGLVDGQLGLFGPPFQPNDTFGMAFVTVSQFSDVSPLYSVGGPRSIQLSLRLRF